MILQMVNAEEGMWAQESAVWMTKIGRIRPVYQQLSYLYSRMNKRAIGKLAEFGQFLPFKRPIPVMWPLGFQPLRKLESCINTSFFLIAWMLPISYWTAVGRSGKVVPVRWLTTPDGWKMSIQQFYDMHQCILHFWRCVIRMDVFLVLCCQMSIVKS